MPKIIDEEFNSELFYNIEYLPRVCYVQKLGEWKNLFDLTFIFNDYHLTGQSSSTADTLYEINLYSYRYGKENIKTLNNRDLLETNASLILTSLRPVKLFEAFVIKNLRNGKYLLEIKPRTSVSICPIDECIDEFNRNNHIQCAPCNKLLVSFVIDNYLEREARGLLSKKVKVQPMFEIKKDIEIMSNEFKCSKDNLIFEENIYYSIKLNGSYENYDKDKLQISRSKKEKPVDFIQQLFQVIFVLRLH